MRDSVSDGPRRRARESCGQSMQEDDHGRGRHQLGRGQDALERVDLRDIFDASYRRLVVQLYGVTGDLYEAEDSSRSRWRKMRNGRSAQQRLVPPRDPAGLEEHLEIIEALRTLPEQQRHVIALYYLADLPVDQIAAELGVPSGTVKSRLSRGRDALASSLARAEGLWTMSEDCWRRSARRPSRSPGCPRSS